MNQFSSRRIKFTEGESTKAGQGARLLTDTGESPAEGNLFSPMISTTMLIQLLSLSLSLSLSVLPLI